MQQKYLGSAVSASILAVSLVTAVSVASAATLTAGVMTATNANANTNANINANTIVSASSSSTVNASANNASNVNSNTDVNATNDASVSSTDSSDTGVSVKYKVPAKLFGFIPASITETASVNVNNQNTTSVFVRRPWWAIFYSVDGREDAVSSNIRTHIPQSVSANGSAGLDASTKAELVSGIEAGAQSTFSGSAQ